MSFDDVKNFARMDLAARKVLNGGLTAFDPEADASHVPFEPDQGEDWANHAEADQIIACGDAGWSLAHAREAAAEREAADEGREGWQESRYLIA